MNLFSIDQELRTLNDAPTMSELISELEYIHNSLRNSNAVVLSPGCEGLGQFLKRTLISIVNVLGHIVNNIATILTKFPKDLKRSELKYYNHSNLGSVRAVFGLKYSDIADTLIDYPEAMSNSYLNTSKTLNDFLNTLDMRSTMRSIRQQSEKAIKSISKSPDAVESVVSNSFTDIGVNIPLIAKEFSKVSECFKDKKEYSQKEFKYFFKTPADLTQTNDILLRCEKYYDQVSPVKDDVVALEDGFADLLKLVDNGSIKEISKSALQVLSGYCLAMARLCDFFGISVHDLQRVEHNYVEVLKTLTKKYK